MPKPRRLPGSLRASLIGLVAFAAAMIAPATPVDAATLAGRVVDAETAEALADARITVQGHALTTTSADDGSFSLDQVPEAPYTLLISRTAYEPVLLPIDPADRTAGRELEIALIPTISASEEIVVTASRYGSDVHLSHTNITRAELERKIATDDLPLLLEDTPGLHASSDAGNGVGYTYLNIRGFDQKRVGVMINGIPLNDPEDHQVYWVDIPDLASSVEDVQVQRGITNSLGATTAIGGTVNLVTDLLTVDPAGKVSLMGGSYDTSKQSASYNTGLIGGRFSSALRYSRIASDGYRDRSGSELWGVFWSGRLITAKTTTQANVYTGHELSHHAWDAVDEATLATNRTNNPETYENAIDDFRQPHYELHHEWRISDRLMLKNSLFYIHGEGFYENEKFGRSIVEFSLDQTLGLDPDDFADGEVDLVRRKNVDKDQYGWVPRLTLSHARGRTIVGGDVYTFHSDHSGDVLSVDGERLARPVDYYRYDGDKVAWSVFVNEKREIAPGVTLLVDVQYQHKRYEFMHEEWGNFTGENRHAYEVEYDFFNPKGGVYWRLPGRPFGGEMSLYAHVGVTHREPTDSEVFDTWAGPDDLGVEPLFATSEAMDENGDGLSDYLRWSDPYVREEKATDYELGAAWRGRKLSLTVNGYWMDFENEIIPY
ncbi:MAG: TonB-dependent receptor, partial [bacterium]|nr:TonB-dependent receptor [bacterium]